MSVNNRKKYLGYPSYFEKLEKNGCGPKGFGWLVPDWIGVDLEEACNIHDVHYGFYGSKDIDIDKKMLMKKTIDKRFLKNMLKINDRESITKLGKYCRIPLIYMYYGSVKFFGKKHFLGENDLHKRK